MKTYDIIIAGGGTAGCACAWNAARLGLKTLLIEKNSHLGGAITSQLVVPAMKTAQNGLNTDFYTELIKSAHAQNAQITYADGNQGWFNPLKLPDILLAMLQNTGCEVILDTSVQKVKKYIDTKYNNNIHTKNEKILSVYIDTKYSDKQCNTKPEEFCANYFVDATGDGNLSELCGAELLPAEGYQALSLRFIMAGVDKKAFADWLLELDTDRNVTTAYDIDGDIHLSTACTWDSTAKWALSPLFEDAVRKNILKDTDRAYFQVFSIAGESDKIAFNCPRIVSERNLSPLNQDDVNYAREIGTAAIERLNNFCRAYFKGFENAYLYKIAPELGVRESRRVKGKYILTKEDIYKAKEFENPAAYSNYPIDVHSLKRDASTLAYVQKPYSVPLESLMVSGFENLFVVGRCLSADFYAQAAVRIQPTCFSMGESIAKHVASLHSLR